MRNRPSKCLEMRERISNHVRTIRTRRDISYHDTSIKTRGGNLNHGRTIRTIGGISNHGRRTMKTRGGVQNCWTRDAAHTSHSESKIFKHRFENSSLILG